MTAINHPLIIRRMGCVDYEFAEQKMKKHTRERTSDTEDEVWILEHNPVYTTGKRQVEMPKQTAPLIPLIHSDRGGEMTYHGPGQLIAYFLLNIRVRRLGPRSLVWQLEDLAIDFLASFGISGSRKEGAPGVYIRGKKIVSLGLHTTASYCYHGISINIDMDLSPFNHIEVCGIPNLQMTQLSEYVDQPNIVDAANILEQLILQRFS